jgi:hypothetical protein
MRLRRWVEQRAARLHFVDREFDDDRDGRLDGVDVTAYQGTVQRLIARLVLFVAVLLMPFGMNAAPAAPHVMPSASMPMQHCPDRPPSHHGKTGMAECTMACSSALPADDRSAGEALMMTSPPPAPALAQILRGILLETLTPPPKRS